jgi:S-adenosyl-L-methionine hydrolase (adenosine-forming)
MSETRPIITLTTDFAEKDGYVGALRGVILSICPQAILVDLSHEIPPQDVRAAAFVLYQVFSYYPPHTVHCVVVDPGVGSKRRAIAARTDRGTFVCPDNGVLGFMLAAGQVNVLEAVTLTNPAYQLSTISATFHGRDIFAPAAAYIADGIPLHRFGPSAINLVRLDFELKPKNGVCRVVHIDRFGNLILSVMAQDIINPERVTFIVGDQAIESLSRTFADVPEGQLLAYVGSLYGHIEIAQRNGSAAQKLGVKVGDAVKINGNSLDA